MAGTWKFHSVMQCWEDLADQTEMLCLFKDERDNEQSLFIKIPKSRGAVTAAIWDAVMTDVTDGLNHPHEIDEMPL